MIVTTLALIGLAVSLLSLFVSVQALRRACFKFLRPSKNLKNPRAKRYIIVDVVSSKDLTIEEVESSVRNAVKEMFGRVWLDLANPRVVYYMGNKGIISTNRVGYRVVIASLAKTYEVSNRTVLVVPRRTTGSIKKAKRLINLR